MRAVLADGKVGAFETVYSTTVVAVGDMVAEFGEQGVMILFAENAPEELWEFSVLHRPSVSRGGPLAGDTVQIDGISLPVLAVGDVVEANLLELGHMDVKADGRSSPSLPGDVCVPQGPLPTPAVGSEIRLLRPTADAADEAVAEQGEDHEFS